MLSKLTMIGLNKYSDGALWEKLVLPEGMDPELFINECLNHEVGIFRWFYENNLINYIINNVLTNL